MADLPGLRLTAGINKIGKKMAESIFGVKMAMETLQSLGEATFKQVADAWDRSPKLARKYIQRYCKMGYAERVNPGKTPERFVITPAGVVKISEKPKPKRRVREKCIGIVAQAIKTQPNSVFALGDMARSEMANDFGEK